MVELLELVTEEEALRDRSEKVIPFIRQFFADAGSNPVRAFNEPGKSGGWIFFESAGKNAGRYFKLVTVQIDPSREDAERWRRQFTHVEWFTGRADEILGKG